MADHTALVSRLRVPRTGLVDAERAEAADTIEALVAELDALSRDYAEARQVIDERNAERDRLRQLIEANFDCLPGCSSYGHEENCPAYVGPGQIDALTAERDALRNRHESALADADKQIADVAALTAENEQQAREIAELRGTIAFYECAGRISIVCRDDARAEVEALRKALQFYADGNHFQEHDALCWTTDDGLIARDALKELP